MLSTDDIRVNSPDAFPDLPGVPPEMALFEGDEEDEAGQVSLAFLEDGSGLDVSKGFRSGFVALLGRPNVGKSSLLNRLLGNKVAITSPVVQTTRYRIRGIITRPAVAQLILMDTPGFSKALDALGERLVEEAQAGANEADVCVLVVDATLDPGPGEGWLAEQLAATGKPVLLVLNKIDRLAQNGALRQQRQLAYSRLMLLSGVKEENFRGCVQLSAKTGKNSDRLLDKLFRLLPEGPAYYEEDALTDQRMREMAAEMIREQVLRQTREELPHSVAIAIEIFEEPADPNQVVRIEATIYVDQTSQKPILVGKGGETIKNIGQKARQQLETMIERKVFLGLQVKVKKNWRKDITFLNTLHLAAPSKQGM